MRYASSQLGAIRLKNGREIELRVYSNYIQWRYVGDTSWTNLFPVPIDGEDGEDGRGIASIALHATAGLVKTYRITFTDDTTFDFEVADGEDGTGGGVIQVTGLTLVVANWVADGSLFKYVLSHASITATASVEVIPANASYDVLVEAEPLPETESAAGSVTVWAKAIPSADVPVTINITEVI